MNNKIYLSASMYFMVLDSEFYGGFGSAGFVEVKVTVKGDTNPFTDEFADNQRMMLATDMGVPVNKILFITKEEYDFFNVDQLEYDDFYGNEFIPVS